jgi:hypothetical protein
MITVKNMRKLVICLLCSNLFSHTINSQIRGQIIDNLTKKPVPFANIYYPISSIGTSSDENGYFKLQVLSTGMSNFDSLSISCVGYKTKKIDVQSITGNHNSKIYLMPQPIELAEVIIKPRKRIKEQIKIGNVDFFRHGHILIGSKKAIYFKANQPNAKLMGVSVKPRETCDSAALLLSFYSVKENGTPDKLISKDRIVFSGFKNKEWNKIDLSGFNIIIPQYDFFVVLEAVSKLNNCYSNVVESYWINKKGEKVPLSCLNEWNITLHCTRKYEKHKVYYKYANQEWQFHNLFVPLMKVDLEY